MKKFAYLVLIFSSLVGASYAAAAYGYMVGGPQYAARFAPGDALYTVAVLKELREGRAEKAIELLESSLDSRIVVHSTFEPALDQWLSIFGSLSESETKKIMRKVVDYRNEHPSEASDTEVRDYITSFLKTLSH